VNPLLHFQQAVLMKHGDPIVAEAFLRSRMPDSGVGATLPNFNIGAMAGATLTDSHFDYLLKRLCPKIESQPKAGL
jgi:hypothetical protein